MREKKNLRPKNRGLFIAIETEASRRVISLSFLLLLFQLSDLKTTRRGAGVFVRCWCGRSFHSRGKGSDNRKRNDTLSREKRQSFLGTARQGISVSFLTCHTFKQHTTQHIENQKGGADWLVFSLSLSIFVCNETRSLSHPLQSHSVKTDPHGYVSSKQKSNFFLVQLS